MNAVKALLSELIRCDVVNGFDGNLSYNGIGLIESLETFQKRLHRLYESALSEITFLNDEAKRGLLSVINKYVEQQECFDVPSLSTLELMNREIEDGNNNESLRKERDFVKMIRECVSLQKYYLNDFAAIISCDVDAVCDKQEQPLDVGLSPSIDDDIIKGVEGLRDYLGCGVNTAQDIINSKILEKKGIQYRAGRSWRFNKNKLAELLEKEPEILKYKGRK